MTVAYGDGSIQCLLRDSLQQIGSVDLPSNVGKNDMLEPPSSKIARCLLPTSHLSFSPNGNALVVLDSLGQMCLYRMSPTADPGGAHAPATLTTQFLYALLSGSDTWDIQVKLDFKQWRVSFQQAWSLTQFYSVDFSKSRIDVKKCVFNKRTIKVCVSCC